MANFHRLTSKAKSPVLQHCRTLVEGTSSTSQTRSPRPRIGFTRFLVRASWPGLCRASSAPLVSVSSTAVACSFPCLSCHPCLHPINVTNDRFIQHCQPFVIFSPGIACYAPCFRVANGSPSQSATGTAHRVDVCSLVALGTANGLNPGPPFCPAARCWAHTTVESTTA